MPQEFTGYELSSPQLGTAERALWLPAACPGEQTCFVRLWFLTGLTAFTDKVLLGVCLQCARWMFATLGKSKSLLIS